MRMGQEAVRQNNSQVHTMKQLSVCCGLSRKSSPQAQGMVRLLPAAGSRRTECVLVGVTLRTSYSFGRSIIMRWWERAKRSSWGQLGEVAHWREALEGWTLSSAPSPPSPCSTAIPRQAALPASYGCHFPPQLRLILRSILLNKSQNRFLGIQDNGGPVATGNDLAFETVLGMILCPITGRVPGQVTLNGLAAITPNCKPGLSAPWSSGHLGH